MSDANTRVLVTAIAAAVGVIGAVGLFIYQKIQEQQQTTRVRRDLDKIGETMHDLQIQLDRLRVQQEIQRKFKQRRSKHRQNFKSCSSYSVTDNDTEVDALSTADTDFDDDEFYDFSDMEGDGDNDRISGPTNELDRQLAETDRLVECATATASEEALSTLRILLRQYPDNLEVIWRLARACHKCSTFTMDSAKKQEYILEGIAACEQFDKSDNADLHKWYAILIGSRGLYLPIKEKIEGGHQFRKHVDKALNIRPNDPTLHHLLGRFKFEVASLSWIERKLAATLFAEPPSATYEEAIVDLERAEKLTDKPFKENKLLLGKSYIAIRQYDNAIKWLEESATILPDSEEDRVLQTEADELLSKYSGYRS